MQHDLIQRIKKMPQYHELVSKRSRYSWGLTTLMMLVYYGFTLLTAFNKELLATPIGDNVTTWGLLIGLLVIIFTILITGLYVRRANHEFDELTDQIKKEVL